VRNLKDPRVEALLTMAVVWVLLSFLSAISRVALWLGALGVIVIAYLWPD